MSDCRFVDKATFGLADKWTVGLVDAWSLGLVDKWAFRLVDKPAVGLADAWSFWLVDKSAFPMVGKWSCRIGGRVDLRTRGQADGLPDGVVDRGDLGGGLAAGLVLLGAGARGGRVVDGGAESEARGADRDVQVVEQPARLRLARAARGDAVQDAEEAGAGRDGADEVEGRGHRLEVVDGGPARDDDEVGGPGGRDGALLDARGGVHHGEIDALPRRRVEHAGEARRLGGQDDGEFGGAAVAPARCGGLRIEVDDGGGEAVADGRAGDGEAERGLAGSALLRDDRDGFLAGVECGPPVGNRGQCNGATGDVAKEKVLAVRYISC